MPKYESPEAIYELCLEVASETLGILKATKRDSVNRNVLSQLSRSITSIGANYQEALGGQSKKDFRHKIFISHKEAKESKHWIRLLAACQPNKKAELRKVWLKLDTLNKIFYQTIKTTEKMPQRLNG